MATSQSYTVKHHGNDEGLGFNKELRCSAGGGHPPQEGGQQSLTGKTAAVWCDGSHGLDNLLLAGWFRLCDPEQDQGLFPSSCRHIYPWSCSRLTVVSSGGSSLDRALRASCSWWPIKEHFDDNCVTVFDRL